MELRFDGILSIFGVHVWVHGGCRPKAVDVSKLFADSINFI